MNPRVESYLRRKSELAVTPHARASCLRCRKPKLTCYCPQVTPIVTNPRVVVLMHPLEFKHPVGTGRMAHQCLANSSLILGVDFTQNAAVNALIADPKIYPMVLFPGPSSVNLSRLPAHERRNHIPLGREPVLIVLDGTWHLAKKMLHRSPNLQRLPRLCFTPAVPSGFLVRKQPHPQCFSTIEAIHEVLTLLDPIQGDAVPRPHDVLLGVFKEMVKRQLSFRGRGVSRHTINYQRRKEREAVRARLSL